MRHLGTTTIFVLTLGFAAAAPLVQANDNDHDAYKKTTHHSTTNKTMSTSSFVKEAAQGSMAEVELGRLALDRSQDQDIRQFAQRMVDDHMKANDDLKQLAANKKWKLPTDMSSEQKMCYNRLHDKAGADFDKEYAKVMVRDHDHDVAMFEAYSEHGKDSDLKNFASSTVPTLRDHQQMARTNADKLGVTVASDEATPRHDLRTYEAAAKK